MIAIGYIRTSSENESGEDIQRERIYRKCKALGVECQEVFHDIAVANGQRPQLQVAIDRVVESGGVFVVCGLSRIASDLWDLEAVLARLDAANATIAFV